MDEYDYRIDTGDQMESIHIRWQYHIMVYRFGNINEYLIETL